MSFSAYCVVDMCSVNMSSEMYKRESKSILLKALGVRSFRYTVVSIQVDSIEIEVVSRHHRSRFDTRRKSIRFNSIFKLMKISNGTDKQYLSISTL